MYRTHRQQRRPIARDSFQRAAHFGADGSRVGFRVGNSTFYWRASDVSVTPYPAPKERQ